MRIRSLTGPAGKFKLRTIPFDQMVCVLDEREPLIICTDVDFNVALAANLVIVDYSQLYHAKCVEFGRAFLLGDTLPLHASWTRKKTGTIVEGSFICYQRPSVVAGALPTFRFGQINKILQFRVQLPGAANSETRTRFLIDPLMMVDPLDTGDVVFPQRANPYRARVQVFVFSRPPHALEARLIDPVNVQYQFVVFPNYNQLDHVAWTQASCYVRQLLYVKPLIPVDRSTFRLELFMHPGGTRVIHFQLLLRGERCGRACVSRCSSSWWGRHKQTTVR